MANEVNNISRSFADNVNYIAELDKQYYKSGYIKKNGIQLGSVEHYGNVTMNVFNKTLKVHSKLNIISGSIVGNNGLSIFLNNMKIAIQALYPDVVISISITDGTNAIVDKNLNITLSSTDTILGLITIDISTYVQPGVVSEYKKYSIVSSSDNFIAVLPYLSTLDDSFTNSVNTLSMMEQDIKNVNNNMTSLTGIVNDVIPNIASILNSNTSATIATTKASEASASATSASTSADAAFESKNAASTSETNSLASKNAAATSATSAATSATNASNSATNSASSATSALASANTATTKSSEALTSANNASSSATSSANSASAAAASAASAAAVVGNAASTGTSGSYIPVIVNTGAAGTTALTFSETSAFYSQVGNVITVQGVFTVAVTGLGAINVDFTVSLPILPTSNFSSTNDVVGLAFGSLIMSQAIANIDDKNGRITSSTFISGEKISPIYFTMTYQILPQSDIPNNAITDENGVYILDENNNYIILGV